MENFEVMTVLFAVVLVGYVVGKLKYMGVDFDKRLSGLIINVTCPALILSSTMSGTLPERELILPLLGISLLTYMLLTVVAFTLPRLITRRRDDEGVVGFSLMFGNVGFIGYPVVASIFGAEAVFYAAMLNVINTFAVFTVGTLLLMGGRGQLKKFFRPRVFYSSPMVAAYLSMLIVALRLDNIPHVVSEPLSLIGNITVPGALLIIGSTMSKLSARTLAGTPTIYVTTLFRLAVIPLVFYYLCTWLGFAPLVVNINTVVIAMPVATYGPILCLKLGRDTTLITALTFITTLLSVFTIPLLSLLFGMN